MLGRLLTGGGMMRAGLGMMRTGLKMRSDLKRKAVSDRIHSVRLKTRGTTGLNNPKLYSKYTLAGQKRRAVAAAKMKAIRNAPKIAAQQRAIQAYQAHRVARHNKIRNITRIGFQGAGPALSKQHKHTRLNRQLLAQALKTARRGPHQSPMFGYRKGTTIPRTVNLTR